MTRVPDRPRPIDPPQGPLSQLGPIPQQGWRQRWSSQSRGSEGMAGDPPQAAQPRDPLSPELFLTLNSDTDSDSSTAGAWQWLRDSAHTPGQAHPHPHCAPGKHSPESFARGSVRQQDSQAGVPKHPLNAFSPVVWVLGKTLRKKNL